ncbi:hypothetical protein ACFPES_28965 [Paenibacillus sp. GCM10023248]|uniref:hypothetical protein n=1 Tax=Bacillales TaxID=1385 RepID=UPI002378BD7A|nr:MULTISPECIES: hypothetical protein [Bacillales]MDD9271085.1 hypothetical protein [Paenibacillus sp. MAHUQ-63]MDR6885056.1 hypothetical protein [Bacillus sp. 3255]
MQKGNRDNRELLNSKNTELAHKRKMWIDQARPLLPLLFIWGAEWIFSALVDVAVYWRDLEWLKQAALITAVVASLIQLWSLRKGFSAADENAGRGLADRSGWGHPALLLLPGMMLIAAVATLEAIGAIGPLFIPVLRAFLLAVGFVQVGLLLGRPMMYLGLWLFVFTAIMSVWYLGYSGVVLEGMGGLSLMAGGYMLRVWGREG